MRRAPRTVEVTCHALNPDPKKRGRCGQSLGDVAGDVHFITTSVKQPAHAHGRIRLQCKRRDCRAWNVFALVAD